MDMVKEIRRRKHPQVEVVLDPDRKILVPLLRQTALECFPVGSHPSYPQPKVLPDIIPLPRQVKGKAGPQERRPRKKKKA